MTLHAKLLAAATIAASMMAAAAPAQAQSYYAREHLDMLNGAANAAPSVPLAPGLTAPPPASGQGGDSTSPEAIQKNIAWLTWAASQAKSVAALGPKDEVSVGDGTFYNLPTGYNEITSTLYKPYGGKFSNGPYITFYIRSQPWDPFCIAWQNAHPANMSACDNWYGQHIVLYL